MSDTFIGARIKSGTSQADLAWHLGKPQSYVSKYERGERRLDVIEFVDISIVLRFTGLQVIRKLKQLAPDRSPRKR